MPFPSLTHFIAENFNSQAEAARSLGISVSVMSRIVNGKQTPGWSVLGRMWYFWAAQQNLPGAVTVITEFGDYLYRKELEDQD